MLTFLLTACSKNKQGILVDLSKNNDTVILNYTNLSDSTYVINGIFCRIMHKDEKIKTLKNSEDGEIMPFIDVNNQPPEISSFYYDVTNEELNLQKYRDSIFKRNNQQDYYLFEKILILHPNTSRKIQLILKNITYNFSIIIIQV